MNKNAVLSLTDVAISYPKQRNLKKLFGFNPPHWPLKQINLEVYQGETLGVIGRNGAGKSTLLRLLAGIYQPDKGLIVNHGVKVELLTLQLGFATQLTGRENILLSGMLMGMPRDEIQKKTNAVIDFSELKEFIDEPLFTYSSGMRSRLGLGVALHNKADVILLDESLSVGDRVFKRKARQAIKEYMDSKHTIVIASHGMRLIRQMCDRVIWIDNGVIQMAGEPSEVLAAYENSSNEIICV